MHKLDQVIQGQFPVHVMERYSAFQPLQDTGHRYLVGKDGLKLEIRRPWLHAVIALHSAPAAELPFGECPADSIDLLCGPIPREFGRRFYSQALANLPNECAAWLVWNEHTKIWDYLELQALSASPAKVDVSRPALADGTWLVMDFHSHGHARAFFSGDDDVDDVSEVKLAGVFGSLGLAEPTVALRACLMGAFANLDSTLEEG